MSYLPNKTLMRNKGFNREDYLIIRNVVDQTPHFIIKPNERPKINKHTKNLLSRNSHVNVEENEINNSDILEPSQIISENLNEINNNDIRKTKLKDDVNYNGDENISLINLINNKEDEINVLKNRLGKENIEKEEIINNYESYIKKIENEIKNYQKYEEEVKKLKAEKKFLEEEIDKVRKIKTMLEVKLQMKTETSIIKELHLKIENQNRDNIELNNRIRKQTNFIKELQEKLALTENYEKSKNFKYKEKKYNLDKEEFIDILKKNEKLNDDILLWKEEVKHNDYNDHNLIEKLKEENLELKSINKEFKLKFTKNIEENIEKLEHYEQLKDENINLKNKLIGMKEMNQHKNNKIENSDNDSQEKEKKKKKKEKKKKDKKNKEKIKELKKNLEEKEEEIKLLGNEVTKLIKKNSEINKNMKNINNNNNKESEYENVISQYEKEINDLKAENENLKKKFNNNSRDNQNSNFFMSFGKGIKDKRGNQLESNVIDMLNKNKLNNINEENSIENNNIKEIDENIILDYEIRIFLLLAENDRLRNEDELVQRVRNLRKGRVRMKDMTKISNKNISYYNDNSIFKKVPLGTPIKNKENYSINNSINRNERCSCYTNTNKYLEKKFSNEYFLDKNKNKKTNTHIINNNLNNDYSSKIDQIKNKYL